jgi:exonuclease SbcC
MRITRLGFAGFGPYRHEQWIDFRAFEDDGIYLIGGRTGAGKSTILDAVCFALYASVPRFEKGEARLRSDHCAPEDPTWVTLEFSAAGRDYRVTRTPTYDRPKARGEGTTTKAPTAELAVLEDGEWRGVAAKPREVGIELAEIVQLTRDQFLQVILLAQNRFQRFLAASNDERQEVLRSLFATERFSSFEDYLVERRKEVEKELGAELETVERLAERARALAVPETQHPGEGTGDVDGDGDEESALVPDEEWFAGLAASVEPARRAAELALARADAAARAADEADRRAEDLARRIQRREAALAVRDALAARAQADAHDRAALAAARSAAPLWPLVLAVDSASERLRLSETAESEARAVYRDVLADAPAGSPAGIEAEDDRPHGTDDPREAVDRWTRELGSLAESVADERSLPGLERDVEAAARVLAEARAAAEAAAARRRALPADVERARAAVATASATAAGLETATATVEGLKRRVTAAHDARGLATRLSEARAAEITAMRASREATAHLESLLVRRLAGHAAELAEALVDGEPCSVCGATEHPSPASNSDEPVREEDIEAARSDVAARSAAADAAVRVARESASAHEQALVASGGDPVEELDALLAEAETQRDACASASARLAALEAEVERLLAEAGRADDEAADRERHRDAAAERHVAAVTRLDAVRARVDAARGDSASVADRVDRITRRRECAARLVAALDDRAECARELDAARAALAEALAGSDGVAPAFSHSDDVRAAHLPESEIRRLEALAATAAEERAANAAVLADPELAELPEEAPDTAATADARRRAAEDRDAALSALHAIERRESDLAAVRRDALSALSAVRARRDEVEAIRGLADTVEGKAPNTRRMDLETFVLAAQLEQIIAAANRRFAVMTSGRFALEHDDTVAYRNTASGLGLAIRDEYTGRSRPTASLSGGETFLAALALALGLAEVVTERAGGITLETLFIDEGFGSLDGETLEIAMSTLDELRAGGRTVGLISHVDAMKERIAARLTVEVDETGASHVRQQRVPTPA